MGPPLSNQTHVQALTLRPNVLKVLTSTNSSSHTFAQKSAKIVICVMGVVLSPFVSIVSKDQVNVQNFAKQAKRNAVPVMKLLDYVKINKTDYIKINKSL